VGLAKVRGRVGTIRVSGLCRTREREWSAAKQEKGKSLLPSMVRLPIEKQE
jgi:hypothetical protein